VPLLSQQDEKEARDELGEKALNPRITGLMRRDDEVDSQLVIKIMRDRRKNEAAPTPRANPEIMKFLTGCNLCCKLSKRNSLIEPITAHQFKV